MFDAGTLRELSLRVRTLSGLVLKQFQTLSACDVQEVENSDMLVLSSGEWMDDVVNKENSDNFQPYLISEGTKFFWANRR